MCKDEMLVWDSELTGPVYAKRHYVEYAKLRWDEGAERVALIHELRNNGLSLAEAAFIVKHLAVNYMREQVSPMTKEQCDF